METVDQLIETVEKFVDNHYSTIVTYECGQCHPPHSFETFQTNVYSSVIPCINHPNKTAYAIKARSRR